MAYAIKPNPPAISTEGKIAKPSNPSVKFTALEAPIMTNIEIHRKRTGEIEKINSLLNGKINI